MTTTTYDQLVSILTTLHDAPADRINPEATYAELDVDSLTMVEISLRVERNLGVTVEDNELHEDLTLGATAELIDQKLAQ
ncbi:acyl carrier protein [Streptomyces sp. LX-29]|uniref:acyl carrier protein n=1 Tax=unclassified Streptomyces TaxID=2593676 RepID=UPI00118682A8|nr:MULTISPECIES: acyl carrier protein [unclassified Streptomyces]TVL91405.1 acyl carrier protein [Streptomyces sp. SAJ15]WFB10845.1 acyl carrier protein [Streptomyces sp. LX-29]